MRHLSLIAILLVFPSILFAQSEERKIVAVATTEIKKGSELQKTLLNVKITDPKIYDRAGNVVDSTEAIAMVKRFEYTLGWATNKSGEYKRTLFKIDPELQPIMDANAKKLFLPKNPKLREGMILDLKPLSKKLNRQELEGKAILLIFWSDGSYNGSTPDAYKEVNEVLSNYRNAKDFEIIAITHHSIDDATEALKKNPIVNTSHILNAEEVTQAYETENQPLIVLTDKTHKILYSVRGNATMTPRILNNTLKQIL